MTEGSLRDLLNNIRDRHASCCVEAPVPWCRLDCATWPCPDYSDAVAAIAILDAANHEWVRGIGPWRLIPDPDRLVLDPGRAPHNHDTPHA